MTLQDIGEFGLIERIQEIIQEQSARFSSSLRTSNDLRVGIGDDAAVWQPTPGMELVLTCDAFVEGRHFPSRVALEYVRRIGRRVATANLSDLAAMAARPRFALVSLGIPQRTSLPTIEHLYTGIAETMYASGGQIVGGNITSTSGPLFIDITVGGEAPIGHSVKRTGARVGDRIGVTGYPGHAAVGWKMWELQETLSPQQLQDWSGLLSAYIEPTARLQEAQLLAPYVTSMTDISDGLLHDTAHMLFTQGWGAKLFEHALPQLPEVASFASYTESTIEELLLGPSDDYELLFTAPAQYTQQLTEQLKHTTGTSVHWIGEVTAQSQCIQWQDLQQNERLLSVRGWDHFSKTPSTQTTD